MSTSILPLAITMMAGPQIMSAIVFVTSMQALRNSLAFVTGVLFTRRPSGWRSRSACNRCSGSTSAIRTTTPRRAT